MKNEWNDIITALDHATGQSLYQLNDYELDKLEVLLDHWQKLALAEKTKRGKQSEIVTFLNIVTQ